MVSPLTTLGYAHEAMDTLFGASPSSTAVIQSEHRLHDNQSLSDSGGAFSIVVIRCPDCDILSFACADRTSSAVVVDAATSNGIAHRIVVPTNDFDIPSGARLASLQLGSSASPSAVANAVIASLVDGQVQDNHTDVIDTIVIHHAPSSVGNASVLLASLFGSDAPAAFPSPSCGGIALHGDADAVADVVRAREQETSSRVQALVEAAHTAMGVAHDVVVLHEAAAAGVREFQKGLAPDEHDNEDSRLEALYTIKDLEAAATRPDITIAKTLAQQASAEAAAIAESLAPWLTDSAATVADDGTTGPPEAVSLDPAKFEQSLGIAPAVMAWDVALLMPAAIRFSTPATIAVLHDFVIASGDTDAIMRLLRSLQLGLQAISDAACATSHAPESMAFQAASANAEAATAALYNHALAFRRAVLRAAMSDSHSMCTVDLAKSFLAGLCRVHNNHPEGCNLADATRLIATKTASIETEGKALPPECLLAGFILNIEVKQAAIDEELHHMLEQWTQWLHQSAAATTPQDLPASIITSRGLGMFARHPPALNATKLGLPAGVYGQVFSIAEAVDTLRAVSQALTNGDFQEMPQVGHPCCRTAAQLRAARHSGSVEHEHDVVIAASRLLGAMRRIVLPVVGNRGHFLTDTLAWNAGEAAAHSNELSGGLMPADEWVLSQGTSGALRLQSGSVLDLVL